MKYYTSILIVFLAMVILFWPVNIDGICMERQTYYFDTLSTGVVQRSVCIDPRYPPNASMCYQDSILDTVSEKQILDSLVSQFRLFDNVLVGHFDSFYVTDNDTFSDTLVSPWCKYLYPGTGTVIVDNRNCDFGRVYLHLVCDTAIKGTRVDDIWIYECLTGFGALDYTTLMRDQFIGYFNGCKTTYEFGLGFGDFCINTPLGYFIQGGRIVYSSPGGLEPHGPLGVSVDINDFYLAVEGIAVEQRGSLNSFANQVRAAPNPLNPSATISYNLGPGRTGDMRIYDIRGKMVFERAVQDMGTVLWDAGSLPGGVYVLTVVSRGQKFSRKLVLQR